MRWFAALLQVILLVGCGSTPPTLDAQGEFVVRQQVLDFPRTFVGYPTTVDLMVENTGLTPIPIELAISGPFSMASGREQLAGGAVRGLPVNFRPSEPGAHKGTLLITEGGVETEILLRGSAVMPPPCMPSALCREATFDPKTGICSERILPDQASCSSGNLCQALESCRDGLCVGTPVNCGDNDVCTADGCDPQRGCVHVDQSAGCPQPAATCKVAICDADDGCGIANAFDGTPCGPSDCRTAFICLGGSCDEVGVPDGTACIDACGDGKCSAGECERNDGDRLQKLWSYEPPPGHRFLFSGISDGAGQLYWVEDSASASVLVSVTAGGIVRYRMPLALPGLVGERGVALEDGLLLIAAANAPVVAAHLPRDGSSPWLRRLQDELEQVITGCPCSVERGSLTRSSPGRAAFTAAVRIGAAIEPTSTFVAMLRTGSGEVAWAKAFAGRQAAPPIADEAGNLYLLLEQSEGPRLLALDPEGEERWRVAAPPGGIPLFAWEGVILQARDRLVAAADGSQILQLLFAESHAAPPLAGANGSWSFTRSAAGNLHARAFDAAGGAVSVTELFDPASLGILDRPAWSDPVLTRRDTVLLSISQPADGGFNPLLRELERDGEIKRTCSLGIEGTVSGVTSLRAGRWVVQATVDGMPRLQAFALPHGDVAVRGWVGPQGNPAGGGRPQ